MNADQRTITQIVASAANEGRKRALIIKLGELTLEGLSPNEVRDRLAVYADEYGSIDGPELDENERVALTDRARALLDSLKEGEEVEALNTVTRQPRDHYGDWDERQMRRAWALFGQLIMNHVLSIPTFDFCDDEEIVGAAHDIEDTVRELYFSLEGVIDEMNQP